VQNTDPVSEGNRATCRERRHAMSCRRLMLTIGGSIRDKPTKITSHRPSANGVVERVHATLHSMYGKLVRKSQRDWCEMTPYVTYAYNTTIHGATGFSPFYLMHLRRARVPVELLIGTPSEAAYESEDTYVTAASERMRKAYSLVREQLQACFDRAKKRYDERVKTTKFTVGDCLALHSAPIQGTEQEMAVREQGSLQDCAKG